MTDLEALWSKDGPTEVKVGDVFDATGRALDVQRLIMRRWGWPKSAAKKAADFLEERFGRHDGFMLPVGGEARHVLQERLLAGLPGLTWDLMEGIANRAHRDARDSSRPVSVIEVTFVQDTAAGRVPAEIADEGLLTSIVNVVAGRLGLSADDVRERADFHRDGSAVRMTVWVTED